VLTTRVPSESVFLLYNIYVTIHCVSFDVIFVLSDTIELIVCLFTKSNNTPVPPIYVRRFAETLPHGISRQVRLGHATYTRPLTSAVIESVGKSEKYTVNKMIIDVVRVEQ